MGINSNFGKCSDGVITAYAPSPLKWSREQSFTWTDEESGETITDRWVERKNLLHPTEQEYNDMGFFRIVEEPPRPGRGFFTQSRKYVQDGNLIVPRYEYARREVGVQDYNRAVEDHLRKERLARGYDTREPSLYINSSVQRWRQDAEDWIEHVDAVMSYALGVLNAWQNGDTPPSLKEFVDAMPKITWKSGD